MGPIGRITSTARHINRHKAGRVRNLMTIPWQQNSALPFRSRVTRSLPARLDHCHTRAFLYWRTKSAQCHWCAHVGYKETFPTKTVATQQPGKPGDRASSVPPPIPAVARSHYSPTSQPLITLPVPMMKVNGLPLSREESNFSPLSTVPV